MNSGFAIHLHHDNLVEYCFDYEERVRAIRYKPVVEQEVRLRLFKMLPMKAVKEIPTGWRKAYQKCQEAYQKYQEINREYRDAHRKLYEVSQKLRKTGQKFKEANQNWSQTDQDTFHKKWCGCKEWNGKKIVFPEIKEKK